jgi:hypothetical protein
LSYEQEQTSPPLHGLSIGGGGLVGLEQIFIQRSNSAPLVNSKRQAPSAFLPQVSSLAKAKKHLSSQVTSALHLATSGITKLAASVEAAAMHRLPQSPPILQTVGSLGGGGGHCQSQEQLRTEVATVVEAVSTSLGVKGKF